ncbi:hypothetical protein CC80DRAFT_591232 [Byssothecium circinans]|uniref:Aminoglycoside phosphotransferase domain-containing protein n=1 Tax=Byssothecium circinans TaxID=147558 RepID=A0A6A5U2M7_9PLEO|nr:hypothetical protein CC80DRAFT_591232 [Byssothecium circinans]
MDFDGRVDTCNLDRALEWGVVFDKERYTTLPQWLSGYHNRRPCEVLATHHGSFNWSCSVRFNDGITWLVRFAVPGKVMDGDAKVAREVATMYYVKSHTTIPVPTIHHWGLSKDSPSGLGAFIIIDFIAGTSLRDILTDETDPDLKILKSDFPDEKLRILYRQIADFHLQLYKLNFPSIGALSIGDDGSIAVNARPLTLKMQEIEAHSGVKIAACENQFASATEYFNYVAQQDLQHLHGQANSVDDAADAEAKLVFRHQFIASIPQFVRRDHDLGPFKLACDDMRYGNMLVNNPQDLNIVAVIDWEWTNIVPAQMTQSPPQWLMIRKPADWSSCDSDEFNRYSHLLSLYLDEMKKLESNGKFWFHALIESCYDADYSSPWKALRKLIPNLDEHGCLPEPYRRAFVNKKLEDLAMYTMSWEAMQAKRENEKKRKERELDNAIRRVLAEEPDNVPALKLASQRGIIV